MSDAQKALIQTSYEEAKKIQELAQQALDDYKEEFYAQLNAGTIKEDSDAYYEGLAQINELEEACYESATAAIEQADALREIEYTKLQNAIDAFSRSVEKIDNIIKLAEARNEKVSESYYQTQIDNNNASLQANREKTILKLQEQAQYEKGSERYEEIAEEIADLNNEAYDLLVANEEAKDAIFALRFSALEDSVSNLQDIRDELDNFRDLLNEEAYIDSDTGALSAEGAAAIALIEKGIISAKQEIAEYTEGLEKLQEAFDNGLISEEEFNEKNKEYREGIVDAIDSVKEYNSALTDLYLTQLEQENDILKEIIDKRKEALHAKEDYYNYDKTIKSQTNDLNALRAQAAALAGSNSASAQAELKRLQQQIKDAEEELADTKREHSIEMQEQGYDQMADDLDNMLESTEKEIQSNADKQLQIVQEMLDKKVAMYASSYDKINEIIAQTGFVGSTDFEEWLKEQGTQSGSQSSASEAGTSQSDYTATTPVQDIDASNTLISDEDEAFNSKYEKELAILGALKAIQKLGEEGYSIVSAIGKEAMLAELRDFLTELDSTSINPSASMSSVVKQLKEKLGLTGYASGSKYVPEDQFAWTQENGSEIITLPDGSVLTKLPRGSGVVPSKLTENLFGLANSAEDIMANTVGNAMRYINNIVNNGGNNITYHYDSLLTVNGDVDKAVLPELQEILKQSYQYTTQQMTKDALRGGNKLRR